MRTLKLIKENEKHKKRRLNQVQLQKKKKFGWIVTYACDAPFFPDDLVKQFLCIAKKEKVDIVIAKSNRRKHPVFGLWSIKLLNSLEKYLLKEKNKKIDIWVKKNKYKVLNFPYKKIDPFFNINTFNDLEIAKDYFSKITQNCDIFYSEKDLFVSYIN